MSDNPSKDVYNVYLAHTQGRNSYPVEVPADPSLRVMDLSNAIRKNPEIRNVLKSDEAYTIYKYGVKYENSNKFDKAVDDWLSADRRKEQMSFADPLDEHFPDGPAPGNEKKIDVVLATDSLRKSLRSMTPKNQFRLDVDLTPRKPVVETQELVTAFLKRYDAKLREYLSGPAWGEFWEAPEGTEDRTRRFINDLKIPKVNKNAVLLLHGLGEDIVDPSHIENLFSTGSNENKFLVNTSGSGKTRLLFEGLTKHWGFYITTGSTKRGDHKLGSSDLHYALGSISPSKGFNVNPGNIFTGDGLDDAFEFNDGVAKRRVYQILTARFLVLEWFLKIAREIVPSGSLNRFKQHWLFLQLRSEDESMFRLDLSVELCKILKDASNEFLLFGNGELQRRLVDLQSDFDMDHKFFLVLDEAQVAIKHLPNSFRSRRNKVLQRPVLRPIVEAFAESTSFPIIVSGTGLSIEVVNDVVNSSVGKGEEFLLATQTGAFDSKESQREYILRYMPEHIAQTPSGEALIARAWNFMRGRHRFTAVLMAQLLMFTFQSLHRVFNEVVRMFCNHCPTDASRFVDDEGEQDQISLTEIAFSPFDFSAIINNTKIIREISKALYNWIMLREGFEYINVKQELVELGFARFGKAGDREAYIDEPLVLLAAANAFSGIDAENLNFYMHGLLQEKDPSGRGKNFEIYIGYYLACAFDGKTRLCDIFSFGNNPPRFSQEPAELVSVVFTDNGAEFSRFNLLSHELATAAIGVRLTDRASTKEWLENPTTLMCFPTNLMGPDIVLFIRIAGIILTVLVQCKFVSDPTLDKTTAISVNDSLDIRKLFFRGNQKLDEEKAAKGTAFDMFDRLNGGKVDLKTSPGMEWGKWLPDGRPVLRVVASPSMVPDVAALKDHAVLNMDGVEELIDKTHLLRRIMQGIANKRSRDETEESGSPNKRPCV